MADSLDGATVYHTFWHERRYHALSFPTLDWLDEGFVMGSWSYSPWTQPKPDEENRKRASPLLNPSQME